MAALATGSALAAALVVPGPTSAAPPPDDRPWQRGIVMPTVALGAGFGPDLTTLVFGAGVAYYVVNGLAFGVNLTDRVVIYHDSIKGRYPGIEDTVPTNEFRILPTVQYVFYRSRYFSPYAFGGVGPLFLNNGGGTIAEWVAGPGAYIGLGGPVFLDLGVTFGARFPIDDCEDAYLYAGPGDPVQVDACGFGWGPRIGIVLAFGTGRSRRQKKSSPPPPPANPAPREIEGSGTTAPGWTPPPQPTPDRPSTPTPMPAPAGDPPEPSPTTPPEPVPPTRPTDPATPDAPEAEAEPPAPAEPTPPPRTPTTAPEPAPAPDSTPTPDAPPTPEG